MSHTKQHIAIFASGAGSNAEAIMKHFNGHPVIQVALVVSNKADAGVHELARAHQVPSVTITKSDLQQDEVLLAQLQRYQINWIALAGFLLLIPPYLVDAFPNRILNIHPALLPKFGGKGMYGMHVHRAVKEAGEKETGITIHLVNAEYDKGTILAQNAVGVDNIDTPETIRQKVQVLEHEHFPKVIEATILKSLVINQQ